MLQPNDQLREFAAEPARGETAENSPITSRRSLVARTALALVMQTAACSGFSAEIPPEYNDAGEGGADASADSMVITAEGGTDASGDVAEAEAGDADAGTVYGFANDPKKNVCIKWMTMNGGVKVKASPDDNNCDPKPYGALPLAPSLDLGVWSKDAPTNNAIGFSTSHKITTYMTKCSPSPVPPNNAQMETLMLNGGYIGTTNASTLPNVDLTNASCVNGAVYVMHISP